MTFLNYLNYYWVFVRGQKEIPYSLRKHFLVPHDTLNPSKLWLGFCWGTKGDTIFSFESIFWFHMTLLNYLNYYWVKKEIPDSLLKHFLDIIRINYEFFKSAWKHVYPQPTLGSPEQKLYVIGSVLQTGPNSVQ